MDKEKERFSIALEADTSNFKKKMQEASDISRKFGDMIKGNFESIKNTMRESYAPIEKPITSNYDKQIEQTEKKINELINTISKLKEAGTDGKSKQEILDMEVELEKLKSKLNSLYDKRIDILDWEQTEQFIKNLEEELENLEKLQEKINSGHKNIGISAEVVANAIEDTKFQIELAKGTLEDFNDEGNRAKQIFTNLGNEISKGFKQVSRNIKRLTFSMIGVHSAYRILTRAVSTYGQYDIEFTQKMKSAWASLGAFLAPITSMIGTAMQKLVGYFNVFVKALTGIDFIQKANDAYKQSKALKEVSKSAKEATKSLTAMDEITNINENNIGSSGDIDDDFNPFEAIQNVELNQKWVDKIKEIGEALQPVYNTIKDIIQWCLDHPDIVLKVLGATLLIKTIADVLGFFGGIGSATGLLGLLGVLGLIAGIGIITIGIMVGPDFFESVKAWESVAKNIEKVSGLISQLKQQNKNYANSLTEINEEDKIRIKNDNEKARQAIDRMKQIKDETDSWSPLRWTIAKLNGEWKTLSEEYYNASKEAEAYSETSKTLYERGLLDKDLMEDYANVLSLYAEQLERGTYDQEKSMETMKLGKSRNDELRDSYKKTSSTLDILNGKLKNTKTEIDNIPTKKTFEFEAKTDNAWTKIKNFFSNVGTLLGKINPFFNLGTSIGNKIRSYDVGTPYVPEDGLAMIHKGERIIPAEYNNEALFNNNNETTNALLVELIQAVEENNNKTPVFNLNGKEFAKATYNDYKNEEYRLNNNTTIRRV